MSLIEEQKARNRQNMLDRCVHFNGLMNDTCDKDIAYDSVRLEADGKVYFPCLRGSADTKCEHCRYPTEEEVDQMEAESEAAFAGTLSAAVVAKADAEARGLKKGHGGTGQVKCPACDAGQINYSVAYVNGHMWACCTTDGCVMWME